MQLVSLFAGRLKKKLLGSTIIDIVHQS